jgi:PAS domain S-box-containing protein
MRQNLTEMELLPAGELPLAEFNSIGKLQMNLFRNEFDAPFSQHAGHEMPLEERSMDPDPFHSAFYGTRMSMIITNPHLPENPITFVNPSFCKMTGYSRAEIIGRNCKFLQGPDTDPAAIVYMRDRIVQHKPVDIEILNYRKDGSTFWNALHISPVFDRNGCLQYFFGSQIDVTGEVQARQVLRKEKAIIQQAVKEHTRDLQQALDDKATLLQELDHRVKNNLSMLRSLIRVQQRQLSTTDAKPFVDALTRQIEAIALTHSRMFTENTSQQIDIGRFAQELIVELLSSFGRNDVKLQIDIENLIVKGSDATTAALLLNEIITNCCKHAFNDNRNPVLTVTCRKDGNRGVIKISDNGPGFDLHARRSTSEGTSIMDRLARQGRWTVETTTSSKGTVVTLSFEVLNV